MLTFKKNCFKENKKQQRCIHFAVFLPAYRSRLKFFADVDRQVPHAAGIATLIVVPGEDLDEVPVDDVRQFGVHDGRIGAAGKVHGDKLLFAKEQDPLQRTLGGLLQSSVYLVDRDVPFKLRHEVHHRDVRGGYAHGQAVQLAFQIRDHLGDRLGSAGCRGHDGHSGRPSSPQVLMGAVQQALIHSVGMDRCHEAPADFESVVEDLYHGGQAVGRTGGIGNDRVLRRIVGGLVDAHNEGSVDLFARNGKDNFFRTRVEMPGDLVLLAELARRLENDVHAELLPGKIRQRGCYVGDDYLPSVDHQVLSIHGDVGSELAVDRIVLQEMRQVFQFGPGVDRYDFNVAFIPETGPDEVTSDPAESIDRYLYRHKKYLLSVFLSSAQRIYFIFKQQKALFTGGIIRH